jgi:hypothetical protein
LRKRWSFGGNGKQFWEEAEEKAKGSLEELPVIRIE